MKAKIGNILMILGAVLILAALSLFLRNQREDKKAGEAASEILSQMKEETDNKKKGNEAEDLSRTAMPKKEFEGYACVGYLTIPEVGLELPVLAQWDYERLKVAPCLYSGSVFTDDMVIAAHNYKRHFGPIKNLSEGAKVYFTDLDGLVYEYEVSVVEILGPFDSEDMTAGIYDLTLFTCTYGGKSRVTVRCDRTTKIW